MLFSSFLLCILCVQLHSVRRGAAQSCCGQRLISAMASQPQTAPSSVASDDWEMVASDECEKADALKKQIEDADGVCSASESGNGSDAEDVGLSAAERVQRFQHHLRLCEQGPKDDPYWIKSFFEIVEHLDEKHCAHNWTKPLSLVSGCSGMLAEGWACKARFFFSGLCYMTVENTSFSHSFGRHLASRTG